MLGILPALGRQEMISYYVDVWRQYGDIVRLPMGPLQGFLVVRPEDIKRVLVDNEQNYEKGVGFRKVRLALGNGLFTVDGPAWRRQRRLIQPPFTPNAVNRFAPVMVSVSTAVANGWYYQARLGEAVDVNSAMMRLAMSIIARTMLSMDIGAKALEAANAFSYVLEFVSTRSMALVDVPLSVPTPANRRFTEAIRALDTFIESVIEERRELREPPHDLLSILLSARDPETNEGMSSRQLRDEILTIFFAGHETTAQALTWIWHALAQHPEVEGRLHAEVDQVLGGRLPEPADVPRLRYTRMVIEETMRLYPPVWVFVRQAIADDTLGGYDVPAGAMIILSQYITHRHPGLWPEPDKFDPERFAPEIAEGRPRYAYFPFGGGPRVCVGSHFALLEATLAVATIAQHHRLRLVPNQAIRPRMVGTLRPSGPVLMTVHPR